VTHFFNALSLLFPAGERFFMDSVRNYRDRIDDPLLKQQVVGLVGLASGAPGLVGVIPGGGCRCMVNMAGRGSESRLVSKGSISRPLVPPTLQHWSETEGICKTHNSISLPILP